MPAKCKGSPSCSSLTANGNGQRDNGTTGTGQRDNGNGTTGRAVPNPSSTSPEASEYVAQRRLEHEARQAELAGIAAATPGQEPHVNVPWTDEHALAAFKQLNTDRRTQQRLAFPQVTTCQH